MSDFWSCVFLNYGIAWGVGAGIFLITLLLVSRKTIGFFISLLLMLIALGSSAAIANRDQAIKYWNKYVPESLKLPEAPPSELPKAAKAAKFPKHPIEIPKKANDTKVTDELPKKNEENFKGQVERQKQRLDTFTPP